MDKNRKEEIIEIIKYISQLMIDLSESNKEFNNYVKDIYSKYIIDNDDYTVDLTIPYSNLLDHQLKFLGKLNYYKNEFIKSIEELKRVSVTSSSLYELSANDTINKIDDQITWLKTSINKTNELFTEYLK